MSIQYVNVNVNVHVYSPDIPVGSADCTIYTPGIGTHSYSLISSGENSTFVHFAAAIDPLRLCNFNPSNTSCRHDRRSTTAQQPLEQYVL